MRPDRLTRRQLNRATLARQLLLKRSDLSVTAAVENLIGLQSQAPLAHYVGLWSRLAHFDPIAAGAALESGDHVRTHAMRATVHLFTRRDALEIRALMQPMLAARFASSPFPKLLPNVNLAAVCREARSLATERPLSRVELGRRLAEHFPGAPEEPLAYAVTYLEPMVQVPPRGVWGKRGPVRWQTYRGWLGVDPDAPANIDQVVLRYLAAFGPATVGDIRTWSGLSGLREVVDRLATHLRIFTDDSGRELLDLLEAPRPGADEPAPVRFLPEYDNVLLSHDDRTRLIPDRRPVPLPPGDGARVGTMLIDGEFRATWQLVPTEHGTDLQVDAAGLSGSQTSQIEEEGLRLLDFLKPGLPGEVKVVNG
ncbi:MAG TPA: winged helix DNA-binding domain-containing protein [Propionibacteriaceae bacterium]|nr:winged helix DNA-binding domain-containing protein [Propionibacteriaceae bacterium]